MTLFALIAARLLPNRLMERWIRLAVVTLILGNICANRVSAAARPNVLFLIADDLNKCLPCYGYPLTQAPNIERLAKRAVRFDRAYCQYPVCSPSRVSFLSGRRPEQTGMYGNDGESRTPKLKNVAFLPEYFRKQGYFTARVGKVFHIGRDVPECWDLTDEGTGVTKTVYQPQELEKLGLKAHVRAGGKIQGGGGEGGAWSEIQTDEKNLVDSRIADKALEYLEKSQASGKPFFLACGFRRPHLPHLATPNYFALYPAEKMPVPAKSPILALGIKQPVSERDAQEGLRGYLACVSVMDTQLGRILDFLDRNQRWSDTIVVLLGDHGYMLGSRGGWWGKGLPYDEACSTTLLIANQGQLSNVGCKRVVEFLDLYPTLADLCGLPPPVGAEGVSLRPLLGNPDLAWDRPAYSVTAKQGVLNSLAISVEKFRYITYSDGKPDELYAIDVDPREWVNLVGDPAHAEALAKMKRLATDYLRRFR